MIIIFLVSRLVSTSWLIDVSLSPDRALFPSVTAADQQLLEMTSGPLCHTRKALVMLGEQQPILFSSTKYVLRVTARPSDTPIPELDEGASSTNGALDVPHLSTTNHRLKSESSTDSTEPSHSSSGKSSTTTSRMENGQKIPRLAAGVYYKKPTPILGSLADEEQETVHFVPPSPEMRGPPPAWQPPCPPDKLHDYENNYEDPELLAKEDGSRDHLLGPHSSTFNSYEMSLSQQRRSNQAMLNSSDEWPDEKNRVLKETAEGKYYIPESLHTATSTLSPASQVRYHDPCQGMMPTGLPLHKGGSAGSSLLKYPTTTSITGTRLNKKRISMTPEKEKNSSCSRGISLCTVFLLAALLFAILLILILLFRSPSYVYIEKTPMASEKKILDESALRPLPSVIHVGQRVEADLVPNQIAVTELVISRPARMVFNFTVGSGAQVVLLGRHAVPPSLYVHDFYKPLKPSQVTPSHTVEHLRRRRQALEIVEPRSAVVEEFLLDGRWHVMLINDRKRPEPISLLITPAESPRLPESVLEHRCDQDCNGHGECVAGKCKCSAGYAGDACEDPVCPVICSGNGVFSGGACVCKAGFKGKECDLRSTWCEVPDCSGHGRCSSEGLCVCEKGWMGVGCEARDCPHPKCNDHGVCSDGRCYCTDGWMGIFCDTPISAVFPRPSSPVITEVPRQMSVATAAPSLPPSSQGNIPPAPTVEIVIPCVNGVVQSGQCVCNQGWRGAVCDIDKCKDCVNGICESGKCSCYPGWAGTNCGSASCAVGCEEHGKCNGSGTCICEKGWNGDNCFTAGCPSECSGNGECLLSSDSMWHCSCKPDRTGDDCSVPLELDCNDGLDNDSDGLTDCDDPECCASTYCSDRGSCVFSPSPSEVLLRLPPSRNAQFAQRVGFIYQNDIQKYADVSKFNESLVSLVRGRVVWDGGVSSESNSLPLVGVRVSDSHKPLWGFTLTRIDGEFDFVVNGGDTIQLRFQRNPFTKSTVTRYVAPNSIVHIGDVRVYTEKRPRMSPSARVQCSLASRTVPSPVVVPSWKFGTESVETRGLLADSRSVVERIPIPGSSVHLVYDSSRVKSSHSWVVLGLLDSNVDENLRLVHLQVEIAGRRSVEKFAPRPNLTHIWSWDKLNVFQQSEHGLVRVNFRIGYEYKQCGRENEIAWIHRSVLTEGAGARILEGGAWSLNIHHYLDTVNNVLEMGDGGRRFLSQSTPIVQTIAGNGTKRDMECTSCDGKAIEQLLMGPTALAYGTDGSLFVGDNEIIRRIDPNGNIKTILQFSMADTSHSYHLAVSPVDGSLYVSMALRKVVWRVSSFEPADVTKNYEVSVGDGTACTSHSSSCGDGGPANQAQLYMPKGITFDTDGNLYVADGRRVRLVNPAGFIRSLSGQPSSDGPPRCSFPASSLDDVQLEWPTTLSIHKTTGILYILDSNVVYEVNPSQRTTKILLGTLSTCANSTQPALHSVKDIVSTDDGFLYIVESDGKLVNQIRRYSFLSGQLEPYVGKASACSCDVPSCDCDDSSPNPSATNAHLNSPSAVVVDSHGNLLIADSGNAKIKKVVKPNAKYDPNTRLYSVVEPQKNEIYAFNRHGLHSWTQSLTTGKILYNFTYNVDTSLGRLTSIHGAGDLLFRLIRSNETHTTLEAPNGRRSQLLLNVYDGTLDSVKPDGQEAIKLGYLTGGLLNSRSESGEAVGYGYDKAGRAESIIRSGEKYLLKQEQVREGRLETDIERNGLPHSVFTRKNGESSMKGAALQRLLSMDEAQLVFYDGVSSLLDQHIHPVSGEPTILKLKASLAAVEQPSRRELTYRFDWRPFIKRGADRMIAEINGVGAYTTAFDRQKTRDIIRARHNEEELLQFGYSDSGEVKSVEQKASEGEFVVVNLSIIFDSLGRKSSLKWGNLTVQATYDRQNRLMERTGAVTKSYTYAKDLRLPSTVLFPGSIKYSLKYDNKGRLKEVSSPLGEVQSFSSMHVDGDAVLSRKFPFSKKPFRLARNQQGEAVEWITADETHQQLSSYDQYNRLTETLCDSSSTRFEHKESHKPATIRAPFLIQNFTYQGHLTISFALSHYFQNRWTDSSLSVEYDDMLRPTMIQCILGGTAVEPLQLTYDEKSSLVNELSGYQILSEGAVVRIQGHKVLHETTFDEYRRVKSVKMTSGDTRVTGEVRRDNFGRIVSQEWKSPRGSWMEGKSRDALGRVAASSVGDKRYVVTYNTDGRATTMGDTTIEWHAGGVVKTVGNVEYVHDGNGFIIKRGPISFEYDCQGRLKTARDSQITHNFVYDHLGRLVIIKNNKEERVLFYAFPNKPHFVSHVLSSDGKIATFFPDNEGRPFAMTRDGYRYSILTEEEGTVRLVSSESGIAKEVERNPFGGIIYDSDPSFWLPFGFENGIDLPDLSLTILNGRPYDHLSGRFMSFGPNEASSFSISSLPQSLDLFSHVSGSVIDIPMDVPSWFHLIGLSPRVLPSVHLPPLGSSPISTRSFGSLPSKLRLFSSPVSVFPSSLLESSQARITPEEPKDLYSDDYGFSDLFILAPSSANTTVVHPFPVLSADDQNILTSLFSSATELPFRQWSAGSERHFIRSSPHPSLTSESRSHFTVVASKERVELRNGKAKIVVHFGELHRVMHSLTEELKRRELTSIWRAERRRLERGEETSRPWSDSEKSLLMKGAVPGFDVAFVNPANARFPSIYQWKFIRRRS